MRKIFHLLLALTFISCQLTLESPTLVRAFQTPASAEEVVRFSQRAAGHSEVLFLETIGYSESGKPILVVKAVGEDNPSQDRLKVLIFAQQHGNEQSGKEAALLLISDLAKNINTHWLDKLEIWIVPQMNPDGSDANERRNTTGIDLNRDHVVLSASETRALRSLFLREQPHVTIDIHEYQPFRESWEKFGAYKTFDVQAGVPTNLNVDSTIRSFALHKAIPALEEHLISKGFSFQNYLVGPVPNQGRTRHSTVDINDGRNSFAILNTLSFIYEGINGPDGYTGNLENRTYSQYEALIGMIEFLYSNAQQAVQMVDNARTRLRQAKAGEEVAIRMEHYPDGNPLRLSLTSSKTGTDTLVIIENYHPLVKPHLEKEKPAAYLIPRSDSMLVNLLSLHQVRFQEIVSLEDRNIFAWFITSIEQTTDEELLVRLPWVEKQLISHSILSSEYFYVPVDQLHSNFLVTLFEPESMLGLSQRQEFEYLMKEGEQFPILRVE